MRLSKGMLSSLLSEDSNASFDEDDFQVPTNSNRSIQKMSIFKDS